MMNAMYKLSIDCKKKNKKKIIWTQITLTCRDSHFSGFYILQVFCTVKQCGCWRALSAHFVKLRMEMEARGEWVIIQPHYVCTTSSNL